MEDLIDLHDVPVDFAEARELIDECVGQMNEARESLDMMEALRLTLYELARAHNCYISYFVFVGRDPESLEILFESTDFNWTSMTLGYSDRAVKDAERRVTMDPYIQFSIDNGYAEWPLHWPLVRIEEDWRLDWLRRCHNLLGRNGAHFSHRGDLLYTLSFASFGPDEDWRRFIEWFRLIAPYAVKELSKGLAKGYRRCFGLTGRELRLLRLAALGLTTGQIAAETRTSQSNINKRMASAMSKLDAGNRAEAIYNAAKQGLI